MLKILSTNREGLDKVIYLLPLTVYNWPFYSVAVQPQDPIPGKIFSGDLSFMLTTMIKWISKGTHHTSIKCAGQGFANL